MVVSCWKSLELSANHLTWHSTLSTHYFLPTTLYFMTEVSSDSKIQKLRRDGVTIHYQLYSGDLARETMVFVHGWAGSRLDWLPLVEHYHAQGFTCLIYDAPGFGESQFDNSKIAHTADFSLERYTQDLLALLDELGLEGVRLIGHSWGGVIAMEFAARYPERVSNLVVIGAAYFDPKNLLHLLFKWISWLMAWLIVLIKPLLRRSARVRQFSVRRYTYRPLSPAEGDAIMNDVISSDNRALVQTLLAGYEVDFKQLCPAISVPVMYLGGQRDVVAPLQFVKPFVELTPNAKYADLADCGHFPMQEMPNRLIEILDRFWDRVQPV